MSSRADLRAKVALVETLEGIVLELFVRVAGSWGVPGMRYSLLQVDLPGVLSKEFFENG